MLWGACYNGSKLEEFETIAHQDDAHNSIKYIK